MTTAIEKTEYVKPMVIKVKKMTFPKDIISKGRKVVCRQCSSCHSCR